MRSSESPYAAAVSMWLMPNSSSSSSTWSALSCFIAPNAAAPKMMRVLLWPVFPNALVAIMVHLAATGADRVHSYRTRARAEKPASGALSGRGRVAGEFVGERVAIDAAAPVEASARDAKAVG